MYNQKMNLQDQNIEKYKETGYSYLLKKTHVVRFQRVHEIIKDYIKQKSAKMRIVDLGCGDGFHTAKFVELGLETYGLDISEDYLKKAQALGVKTVTGDITAALPFENEYFDIVYSGETIEHIVDVRQLFTELNRILKPNGLLILTTPNLAGLDDRINLLFGRKLRHQDALCESHYLHVRVFTFSSLREVLDKAGFETKYQYSNKIRFGTFAGKELESYKLAKLFPTFGAAIIVGAIKKTEVSHIDFYEC